MLRILNDSYITFIIRNMKRYPDTCAQCGRTIPEHEPAGKRKIDRNGQSGAGALALLCHDCLADDAASTHTGPFVPCIGCGRPLDTAGERFGPYCTDRCRQVGRRNSQPKKKLCQQCSREFTPPRRDAKFCSAACKQKAYRTNNTGKRSLSVTPQPTRTADVIGIVIGETPLSGKVRLEGLRQYLDTAKLGEYLHDTMPVRTSQPEQQWRRQHFEPWCDRMYTSMDSADLPAMFAAIGHPLPAGNDTVDWRVAMEFMHTYGQAEALHTFTDKPGFSEQCRAYEETNRYWQSPLETTD